MTVDSIRIARRTATIPGRALASVTKRFRKRPRRFLDISRTERTARTALAVRSHRQIFEISMFPRNYAIKSSSDQFRLDYNVARRKFPRNSSRVNRPRYHFPTRSSRRGRRARSVSPSRGNRNFYDISSPRGDLSLRSSPWIVCRTLITVGDGGAGRREQGPRRGSARPSMRPRNKSFTGSSRLPAMMNPPVAN